MRIGWTFVKAENTMSLTLTIAGTEVIRKTTCRFMWSLVVTFQQLNSMRSFHQSMSFTGGIFFFFFFLQGLLRLCFDLCRFWVYLCSQWSRVHNNICTDCEYNGNWVGIDSLVTESVKLWGWGWTSYIFFGRLTSSHTIKVRLINSNFIHTVQQVGGCELLLFYF